MTSSLKQRAVLLTGSVALAVGALAPATAQAANAPTHAAAFQAHAATRPAAQFAGKTTTRARIIEVLESQLGVSEPTECNKYVDNCASTSWCAAFVEWVWRHADVEPVPETLVARGVGQWGKDHGLFKTSNPLPGDLVVYGPPGDVTGGHVGMVDRVYADGTITTIDGNFGNKVKRRPHIDPDTETSGLGHYHISGYVTPANVVDTPPPSKVYDELTAVGNETGDGSPELLAVQGAANGGTLWRYTVGHDSVGSRVQVGTGWDGMHDLAAVGDMNGDGKGDLLAIEKKTGKLWLYYGPGFSGADGQRKQLGTGWNAMEELTAVGDVDGDGKGDLLAAEIETGKLWLYHGPNFSGADGQRQQVGTNWDSVSELTNVGDANGDGHQDVVAVEGSTGKLFLYNGPSFSGASRQQVGTGWNRMRSLASPGNRTGDASADLLAIDEPTGHLYLYRGPDFSGTTRLDLGAGWNG